MSSKRRIEHHVDPIVVALQRERERQGLSQAALARRTGLKAGSPIDAYERGVTQPGLVVLRRWSAALGCVLALESLADRAQRQYDAAHNPSDHHCLDDPCVWHPTETRIRPRPTYAATLVPSHDCGSCRDCLHNGNRCCGCYDGACCRVAQPTAERNLAHE